MERTRQQVWEGEAPSIGNGDPDSVTNSLAMLRGLLSPKKHEENDRDEPRSERARVTIPAALFGKCHATMASAFSAFPFRV